MLKHPHMNPLLIAAAISTVGFVPNLGGAMRRVTKPGPGTGTIEAESRQVRRARERAAEKNGHRKPPGFR